MLKPLRRTPSSAAGPSRQVGRWALALVGAAVTAALATGCGIRPTAVPVDAGAPASRTACPSPVHPPAVASSQAIGALKGSARPTPEVSPAPSLSPPSGSLFSAQPSPTPSPSGSLRCE